MAIAGTLVVTVTAKTQDFENGMKKTTAVLKLSEQQAEQVSQAFNGLGASLSNASGKSQTMAQSTASINRHLKDTGGVMSEIKQSLTGLVAGFVAFSALKAGVTGVVDAALKQERLVSILTAVTGSQDKASEAMAFARAEAERFGVAMNAATEGYARLLGATKSTVLEGQRTREMYSNLLAVMSTYKVSAEDQNDILRATTQILQQQAIQGDELKNEIGSRIPIMQKLVEASNGAFKTQLEFNKAMEEGKLKGEAASAIMYNLFQIMARDATKAGKAGQGAAAEFARFTNTIQELKEAIGVGLLPVLGEATRAMAAFLQQGKEGAGIFGGEFVTLIRMGTSAMLGLAGSFVIAGKYAAAWAASTVALMEHGSRVATETWNEAMADIAATFNTTIDLMTRIYGGGFAGGGAGAGGVGGGALLPVLPGGGTGGEKKSAAQRESERIAERQKDIIDEITTGLEAQEAVLERGITLEQARLELRLKQAGFAQRDIDTLMAAADETEMLKKVNEEHVRNKEDLVRVQSDLQKAFDKELYTEREILRQRLASLGADEAKITQLLTLYDRQVAAEKERKAQEKAIEESLQAQKDHVEKIASLQKQLEPQKRFRSRREELQAVQKEMIQEGANEYELAASDVQIATTLMEENWDRMVTAFDNGMSRIGDELSNTFIDMATTGEFSFKRLADSLGRATIEMLADILDLKTAIADWLKQGLTAAGGGQGGWFQSLFNLAGSTGGGASTAALQTDISASMAASPELFAFGGGMAGGGPVFPNRMYMVGERGPEMFVPGRTGTIVPNGGGTTVVNMTINTPDAGGFRASRTQILNEMTRGAAQARRNR